MKCEQEVERATSAIECWIGALEDVSSNLRERFKIEPVDSWELSIIENLRAITAVVTSICGVKLGDEATLSSGICNRLFEQGQIGQKLLVFPGLRRVLLDDLWFVKDGWKMIQRRIVRTAPEPVQSITVNPPSDIPVTPLRVKSV